MNLLISITLATVIILLAQEKLRRQPAPFYIVAILISLTVVTCTFMHIQFPAYINSWIWPVFSRGGLAGAFFIYVMYAGALPTGSFGVKKLMPVRRQLSIIACILTLGHNIAYGKTYFVMLFARPENLPANQFAAAICSIIMIIIMLPLFVTSFLVIRKKMDARKWKKLQRTAYIFYGLLYCHILLLMVPSAIKGRSGYGFTVFIYSAIYISYAACRILKQTAKKKKSEELAKYQKNAVVCATIFSMIVSVMIFDRAEAGQPETQIKNQTGQQSENLIENQSEVPSDHQLEIQKENTSGEKEEQSVLQWKDGEYTGSAMGMNAEIEVRVTVQDARIVDITILSQKDDPEYFVDAVSVIDSIIETNDVKVDTVSGATYSSGGIIDAVENALKKAEK